MKIKVPKKISQFLLKIKNPFRGFLTKKRTAFIMKYIIPIFVVLVALFFVKSLFVAAWVNGRPVFRVSLIKELEKQGGTQVLDSLITEKLISQEASRNKISVAQNEIDEQITLIENQLKEQGVDLETALSMQGQTRGDLEKSLKLKLFLEKILADQLNVSETEIEEYFNTNKATLYKDQKLADVSASIASTLKQQKLSEKYQELITQLKEKASVKYWLNF